jgi:hypothetical protein
MTVFRGTEAYASSPLPGATLTIGNFDGVHRGHLHLLQAATAFGPCVALTFDPAPRDVLQPGHDIRRIQTQSDRVDRLLEAGVRAVIVEPFDLELAAMEPIDFARRVLSERIRPRAVVLGYDFRFGRKRAGTVDALRGYGVGLVGLIAVKVLAPGFYARQDIRTPVRIAIAVLLATQVMNLLFVPWLGHDGLALSIGLGGLLNAGWVMVGLRRRGLWRPARDWGRFLVQVGVGCAVLSVGLAAAAGAVPWVGLQAMPMLRAGGLGGVVLAAAVVYLGTLYLCGLRVHAFARRLR